MNESTESAVKLFKHDFAINKFCQFDHQTRNEIRIRTKNKRKENLRPDNNK